MLGNSDLPVRLTLMQAVAWIATRDARVVRRAAWKPSNQVHDDPLYEAGWEKVEACFPADGGITLLSLNLWNCVDRPEASIVPVYICDSQLAYTGDDADTVAERSLAKLLGWLREEAVPSTRQNEDRNRVEIAPEDWEDRYIDALPTDPKALAVYRRGGTLETNWGDVRISRDPLLRVSAPPNEGEAQRNASSDKGDVDAGAAESEIAELRSASEEGIRGALRAVYNDPANDQPNVNAVVPLVQERLRPTGHKASKQQIQLIADEKEFRRKRRPVGARRSNTGKQR